MNVKHMTMILLLAYMVLFCDYLEFFDDNSEFARIAIMCVIGLQVFLTESELARQSCAPKHRSVLYSSRQVSISRPYSLNPSESIG